MPEEKIQAVWKGWEYETANGLHMYMSKRHVFVAGHPVCGVRTPNPNLIDRGLGEYACHKCQAWIDKHAEEIQEV
jgi:hypothetical protein